MSTCHCGRTKANHEPSMHRFTARPQVKETTMPNPATDGRLEPGTYPRPDGGVDIVVDLAESVSYVRDMFPDEVEAIEQEAAAGSARREAALRSLLGYLWIATGKDDAIRTCDLFRDDDPLVHDVLAALTGSRP